MFEKLGYELKTNDDIMIEYAMKNTDECIRVYKEPCYTISKYRWSYYYEEEISCEIEVEELQAINKQVEELGWLGSDDNE